MISYIDEKIGLRSDKDMKELVQTALYDRADELECFHVKIIGSIPQYCIKLVDYEDEKSMYHDIEPKDNKEERILMIYNKFLNLLIILACVAVVFQMVSSLLIQYDADISYIEMKAISFYTVTIIIPIVQRMFIILLIYLFLVRCFIVFKVFKHEIHQIRISLFEKQFQNYLTYSLYLWLTILASHFLFESETINLYQANITDNIIIHSADVITAINIDYSNDLQSYLHSPKWINMMIDLVDYSWFGITGVTFICYVVYEVTNEL